ncbi:MAG: hypothetical protein ACRCYY_05415 [Trueperaceae bacterium]
MSAATEKLLGELEQAVNGEPIGFSGDKIFGRYFYEELFFEVIEIDDGFEVVLRNNNMKNKPKQSTPEFLPKHSIHAERKELAVKLVKEAIAAYE